ncbi:hypothetical protein D0Z00_004246 [Geotrichum galactomycetum]|uniref:Uncharacterized protein n=1 Tax=Geotrichum galactomycetum TaxID=27317 RepID=A0ACB6UYY3_9ASCO|nr:hypothetical protein D0Z00_004246 [Geotrichum candidum]
MIFPKSYLLTSLLASVATAQEWGNFSGQVDSVKYVSEGLYALTSDITVSLAEGWSFVDIIGRNEGQISNKSIVYNSVDSKYYGKLAYTNNVTSDTSDQVCFPSVPIRISLNQEVDGSTSGRLINGNMYIGCIEKSRIASHSTSTASSTSDATSKAVSATTTVAASSSVTDVSTSAVVSTSSELTALPTLHPNVTSTHTGAEAPIQVNATSSSSTGVYGNKTLVTSYAPTGTGVKNVTATRAANVTGTGVVINQNNSGATTGISSVLTLGAIVLTFALLA